MNLQHWRKSSYSGTDNNCLLLPPTLDALRDTKTGPTGPTLGLTAGAVQALVAAARAHAVAH